MLYDKLGNSELYDKNDLKEIGTLISDIQYRHGFLEAVKWEHNKSLSNLELARENAIMLKELIKRYRNVIPGNVTLLSEESLSRIEGLCNRFK